MKLLLLFVVVFLTLNTLIKILHQSKHLLEVTTPRKTVQRIGIFLQIFNESLLPPLRRCAENVARACVSWNEELSGNAILDIHVSLFETEAAHVGTIKRSFYFEGVNNVFSTVQKENRGADVGQFLSQLAEAEKHAGNYDIIMKMHSKSDDIWRERALESLCGSESHVTSIFKAFSESQRIGIIAPLGTTFSHDTLPTSKLKP